jgi:hypothetical protein
MENKKTKHDVSQLQKGAFILSIIGIFIPIIPILAIVFSGLTLKEKPGNWRAKWGLGFGIIGLITSIIISFIIVSYLILVITSVTIGAV